MTPANISFRTRSKARFVLPVLIVLLVLGGALFAIGRKSTPGKKKAAVEKTPQVAFAVAAFDTYGEALKGKKPTEDRAAILTFFNDFYETAFVDPARWKDPTFAVLAQSFAPEARPAFTKDLAALTIAEGRTEFKRVEPSLAQMRLSIYYDKVGRPAYAVAAIHFAADATTSEKRRVNVVQDATFRLQKTGSNWVIFSWDASAHQDTPAPTLSPSASPVGSPT